MAISVRDLDPLHYVTAERVAQLRVLHDEIKAAIAAGPDGEHDDRATRIEATLTDVRVLLMALEQLTDAGK